MDTPSTPALVAFRNFIGYLKASFKPWYSLCVNFLIILWYVCQGLSILCGFATALIAAFIDEKYFKENGKLLLIIFPSVGSLAASILLQFRVFDLWKLREKGRVAIEQMISMGYMYIGQRKTEAEYSKLHKDYIDTIYKLEEDQGTQFFKLSTANSVYKFKNDDNTKTRK